MNVAQRETLGLLGHSQLALRGCVLAGIRSRDAPGLPATPATPTLRRKFVWYNWLLLRELNALDGSAIVRTYTSGLDLPGQKGATASGSARPPWPASAAHGGAR